MASTRMQCSARRSGDSAPRSRYQRAYGCSIFACVRAPIRASRSFPHRSSFSGALKSQGAAPDIRLSYRPSRDRLFYLAAAEGYRSAGFNSGGPVGVAFSGVSQPSRRYGGDELWSYEVGARFGLLNDRLDLRVTAFWNEWRDVQTDALVANGFTYSGNVGHARAVGLETEATWRVTDDVTLRAQNLINEPELSYADPSFPGLTDTTLPGAPEFSSGVSAHYERELSAWSRSARAFGELGVTYTGSARLSFSDVTQIGDYAVVNARAGLQFGDWEGALGVTNLANADGFTFAQANPYRPDVALVTPIQPRVIGISVRRSF